MKTIAILACVVLSACSSKSAEDKIQEQIQDKVHALTADERLLAAANAKTYFERNWINANNKPGQFTQCRPSDSNFNGLVSCFGLIPQPNGTYQETKQYCGYKPELVGCSNEDTVK